MGRKFFGNNLGQWLVKLAAAFFISGCGGAGPQAEVSFFHLQGDAQSNQLSLVSSETKFVLDSAATGCDFSFDSLSNSNNIEIVEDALTCADPNKCIECTLSAAGSDCSIDCNGIVPSNISTANDFFNVYITFISDFTTNTLLPAEMIRFDTSSVGWEEFDLTQTPEVDLANCDGPPNMTISASNPAGVDASSATSATKGYSIDAVGDGTCTVLTTYLASMPLTGAEIPGTLIDLVRTSIDFTAKICDTATAIACPGPP